MRCAWCGHYVARATPATRWQVRLGWEWADRAHVLCPSCAAELRSGAGSRPDVWRTHPDDDETTTR